MTQEEKKLLLKDLCTRLLYDIKVNYENRTYYLNEINPACKNIDYITVLIQDEKRMLCAESVQIENIKPYLRPISSMTENERNNLKAITCPNGTGYFNEQYLVCPINHFGEQISFDFMSDIIDWLNSHYFDYRGLIPMGLALEATEVMYSE